MQAISTRMKRRGMSHVSSGEKNVAEGCAGSRGVTRGHWWDYRGDSTQLGAGEKIAANSSNE